jgi:hypothetical protein
MSTPLPTGAITAEALAAERERDFACRSSARSRSR